MEWMEGRIANTYSHAIHKHGGCVSGGIIRSSQNAVDHFAMNVGQAIIAALEPIGQPGVIEPQTM